jgi:hypothetical protein
MIESRSDPMSQSRPGHVQIAGVRTRVSAVAAIGPRWECAFGRPTAIGMERKQTSGRAFVMEVDF